MVSNYELAFGVGEHEKFDSSTVQLIRKVEDTEY